METTRQQKESAAEAERLRENIEENEPNYNDDPQGEALDDENPEAPTELYGDHEDDFDIG